MLLFAPKVAFYIRLRLPLKRGIDGRLDPLAGGNRAHHRTMSEWVMIALHHIVDAQGIAGVAGNGKADGVGTIARGKSRAGAACVSQVAALPERGVIRLEPARHRPAGTRPRFP